MLPDGWEERVSKSTRRIYFYNRFVVAVALRLLRAGHHHQFTSPHPSRICLCTGPEPCQIGRVLTC